MLRTRAKTTSVWPSWLRSITAASRAGDRLNLPDGEVGGGRDADVPLQRCLLGVPPDPVLVHPDAPVLGGGHVVAVPVADPRVRVTDGGAAGGRVEVLAEARGVAIV